jgi:hypothetical protein
MTLASFIISGSAFSANPEGMPSVTIAPAASPTELAPAPTTVLLVAESKESKENKENIKTLLHLNNDNFNIIRNKEKYDLDVLRIIAYENTNEFRSIMNDIPNAKWFNFNYVLGMLDLHPQSIQFIPEVLFNNKTFTLSFFDKLEEKNKKSYVNELPEKIKSFLQENNIKDNYSENLSRHFSQDYFEKTIEDKNITTKKNKI